MLINNQQPAKLREVLEDLFCMARLDINYDGNSDYVEATETLKKLLTDNVEQANNLIDTLNFDNPIEAHILSFVPDIVGNFRTLEDRISFVSHLESLQERFPNVSFSPALFYASLSCGIDGE